MRFSFVHHCLLACKPREAIRRLCFLSNSASLARAHYWGLSRCREFLSEVALILECSLGLALQLPDPLARDLKLLAQIGEGGRLLAVQAVAADQGGGVGARGARPGP